MTIRLLEPKDAASYRQLRLHSFQASPYAFSESYTDEVQRSFDSFVEEIRQIGTPPEWFVIGAWEEERFIGFVKFRRDQRTTARHKAMVHAMYVHDDYRRHGVGQALMENALGLARQMEDLTQIHLWVLLRQGQSAQGFYQRLGFVQAGPSIKEDILMHGEYLDAIYMVLRLDG